MTQPRTRLTLFTLTLRQDSALSVSGLDRESSADHPFSIVNGEPILAGRGIKGAALAMARRFFDPLPRAIADDIRNGALRRSAWEFADARPRRDMPLPRPGLRAGVGIAQRTGARRQGVLYDHEVMPAGTVWELELRVDWSYIQGEGEGNEVVGILGYILGHHWQHGRCWLGGDVARGLGWCTAQDVQAYMLSTNAYDAWVGANRARNTLPRPLAVLPTVTPTRSWSFRTLAGTIAFGEYQPDGAGTGESWGLDMLAIGPHDAKGSAQSRGDGTWAQPAWTAAGAQPPETMVTDRPILMDRSRPLIPGASLRGPLRHALSRRLRATGSTVEDPHAVQGKMDRDDPAGKVFGTVEQSSRVLIRDSRADRGWTAAKLHMHAEDEFSASSYGSAKRDAVRLLSGTFPIQIVVEGPSLAEIAPLVTDIDRQVALGALGHLPIGGHKTRGAGWGRWRSDGWAACDVVGTPRPPAPAPAAHGSTSQSHSSRPEAFLKARSSEHGHVVVTHDHLDDTTLTLKRAADLARTYLRTNRDLLVAWWCDPTVVLGLSPPATFGTAWPDALVEVDEVAYYGERAVWRASRTAQGVRWVAIAEVAAGARNAQAVTIAHTPARLHNFERFASARTGRGRILLREWRQGDTLLGFTIAETSS